MKKLLWAFISAMFLFNAIPHLVQGICGKSHMTPFAVLSPAVVNVIWAWINLVVGWYILRLSDPKTWNMRSWGAFCLGGVIISLYLAVFWSNPEARLPWH
ncbi:MAG: hypothetical protein V2J25_17680 [Desulfatiglans sp.]|jgi:peptidoglycan biosynthesis protein MviN/MurJ (putative lipid II flippase)|nr:hypothetical protein [Thermodesulfobacteriota bacterium]MEE4354691.1 hypothetical protein [Desulfatiglans sp.]